MLHELPCLYSKAQLGRKTQFIQGAFKSIRDWMRQTDEMAAQWNFCLVHTEILVLTCGNSSSSELWKSYCLMSLLLSTGRGSARG